MAHPNKLLTPSLRWWMRSKWSTLLLVFSTRLTKWLGCSWKSLIKWSQIARLEFFTVRRITIFGAENLFNWLKSYPVASNWTRNTRIATKKPKKKWWICPKEKPSISQKLRSSVNLISFAEESWNWLIFSTPFSNSNPLPNTIWKAWTNWPNILNKSLMNLRKRDMNCWITRTTNLTETMSNSMCRFLIWILSSRISSITISTDLRISSIL